MPCRIKIDRGLRTGYAECVGLAPEVFRLGDDNISVVMDPEGGDDEAILDAARACPVDAITLRRRVRRGGEAPVVVRSFERALLSEPRR
jgi:ferredoxin